jgi:hypothetical protein
MKRNTNTHQLIYDINAIVCGFAICYLRCCSSQLILVVVFVILIRAPKRLVYDGERRGNGARRLLVVEHPRNTNKQRHIQQMIIIYNT